MTDEGHLKTFEHKTCNAEALSELFGITRESISRLAKVDGMPRAGRGRYNVIECVRWLLDRERVKNGQETPADKRARMEVAKQQTIRYKIENARNLGELLPRDMVAAQMNTAANTLATQLDGEAARLAPELVDIDKVSSMQRALLDGFRAIRTTYADALELIASDADSSADNPPATKPKRRPVGRKRKGTATGKPGAGQIQG